MILDGNAVEFSTIKLILEYFKKLSKMRDLKISLNDIKSIDDKVLVYLADKLALMPRLEIVKLSVMNTSVSNISSIGSLMKQ